MMNTHTNLNRISRKSATIFSVVVFVFLVIDQVSKQYFEQLLSGGNKISIIPNFLQFAYVQNYGAAFGSFSGNRVILIFIALISVLIFGYLMFKYQKDMRLVVLIGIVTAGALGNLIDRILFGYVIDFIHCYNLFGYDFPVFNMADIYLSCGLTLLALILVFYKENKDDK